MSGDLLSLGVSIVKSIYKLRKRFQQMKIDAEELWLLEEHITYINKLFDPKKGDESSSSSKQVSDPYEKRLQGTFEEVQKTIEGWLSKEPGFLSVFTSDLAKELETLTKKVHRAIDEYKVALTKQTNQMVKDLWKIQLDQKETARNAKQPPTGKDAKETSTKNAKGTSTKDAKGTSTKDAKGASTKDAKGTSTKDAKGTSIKDAKGTSTRDPRPLDKGKPHRRRSTSDEPRKVPRENQDEGPKDSNHQGPIRSPKPNTHTWVFLWARLDSEKQAKDVEDKLKNSQDVKVEKVSCDQPTNKVRVKVKAMEVKDDSKIVQRLLHDTKDALPSYKVLPTLWKNRPK